MIIIDGSIAAGEYSNYRKNTNRDERLCIKITVRF